MEELIDDAMEAVRSFLREHVAGYTELGVLLLLRDYPERQWSAPEVSEELDAVSEFALLALQALAAHGLLRSTTSVTAVRFQFAPKTPDLAEAVEALAAAYEERRLDVVQAMSENAMARVREAAGQAFVLRRGRS